MILAILSIIIGAGFAYLLSRWLTIRKKFLVIPSAIGLMFLLMLLIGMIFINSFQEFIPDKNHFLSSAQYARLQKNFAERWGFSTGAMIGKCFVGYLTFAVTFSTWQIKKTSSEKVETGILDENH
jgi:hypothetical protein